MKLYRNMNYIIDNTYAIHSDMSRVNPLFYSDSTKPTKTRNASIPIENFPLEKKRRSYNNIVDPCWRVHNSQGFSSSKWRDADADAGKYYYIHINSYDTSLNVRKLIDKVSPLLKNPSTFESGAYYTYMIVALSPSSHEMPKPKPKPELYVTKTANMFEFGTKHHQMMHRLAKRHKEEEEDNWNKNKNKNQEYIIYAAGEIMCENENTLHFNFISGTYDMKRCISDRRRKYEEAYIMHMMNSIAPIYTNIIFQTKALITEDTVPLTKQYLSILRQHNIPVFMYNTREQCNMMKYAIIRNYNSNKNNNCITNDELQEIYIKTISV